MSNTTASLRRKIDSAVDLQAVVRTMKAVAGANIGQYENSVRALADYYRSVELGLSTCFRQLNKSPLNSSPNNNPSSSPSKSTRVAAVVFGSDQGLVGQFNEVIADYALRSLVNICYGEKGEKAGEEKDEVTIWAVGERVYSRLQDAGREPAGLFSVPTSVQGITSLVGKILVNSEVLIHPNGANSKYTNNFTKNATLYLFYNRPGSEAIYVPANHRLLPLDDTWQSELIGREWPSKNLPEVLGNNITATLTKLIREYLFVSLYRACAESLASENASRLSAMQRAEKNIEELLISFNASYRQLRQSGIDEELFDVVSGFEALNTERR